MDHSTHPEPLHLEIDGQHMTPELLVASGYRKKVILTIAQSAWGRIARAREVVDEVLTSGRVVYGVNTGFGANSQYAISPEDVERLQINLIRSHCAGVGAPLQLCRGRSSGGGCGGAKKPHVRAGKRVGLPQHPHGDVLSGPRSDAAQALQSPQGVRRIAARRKEIRVSDERAGERDDRLGSGARHAQRRDVGAGEGSSVRKAPGQRSHPAGHRRSVARHEAPGERSRRGDGDRPPGCGRW